MVCAFALLTLGVVMVNSAGMSVAPAPAAPAAVAPAMRGEGEGVAFGRTSSVTDMFVQIVFSRASVYMALALLGLGLMALVPVRPLAWRLETWGQNDASLPRAFLIVACAVLLTILLLAYIPGLSREVKGARRWITLSLPGLSATSIQPSEIAKWGLVFVLAAYGAWRGPALLRLWSGTVPALLMAGLVAGVVAHEDLGTGVLMAAVAGVILLAAGAPLWHFLIFIPPALALVAGLILVSPYRVRRLEAFFDPYLDPAGSGYHMIQSMVAIAGGEGTGRGLGFGLQKFGYLPEDTTDFLFPVICEELGIAGAMLVIFLYVALIWAGAVIARQQTSRMLKLAAVGIVATIGLQALVNLLVVTGLGPPKGIALPLLSAGGTGWILTAASLGLLVAMEEDAAASCGDWPPARATPGAASV